MTDRPQIVSPAQRACGLCGRTLQLSAQRPGWTPVEHRRGLVWSCPACVRRLAKYGW